MSAVEELANAILKELLADFGSRKLTLNDLTNYYVGANLPALKQSCCDTASASPVDFDLALKDLEDGDFVSTGPMVPFDNPPHSSVVVIGMRSKYEYVSLSEKGYKAAQKAASKRTPPSAPPRVHISGGHFHQSAIGIGSNVTQSVTGTFGQTPVFLKLRDAIANVPNENDRARLQAGVDALETAHNTPDYVSRYANFMQLAANHMTLIAPFIPALAAFLNAH